MYKKYYKLILFFLLANVFSTTIFSQFFNSGNEPFNIQWKYIKNEKFKIIFPENCDSIANKTLNYLNYYSKVLDTIYNIKNFNFPIILHKNTVISNGFVTYGPKRSEFFIFPYPFNYPGTDLNNLSSHEIVHMYQTYKLNNGFTKLLSYIIGDISMGFSVLNLPFWYIEGEAVYYETKLTNSGRGNLSTFKDLFKVYIQEDKNSTYDKTYFGSYKTYVPSIYHSGYFLVDHFYKNFGKNFGDNLLYNVGKKSFIPFYFNHYIKKLTGKSIDKVFNTLKDSIKKIDHNIHYDTFNTLILDKDDNKNTYKSYHSINIIDENKIIALRKDFDNLPTIIEFDIKYNSYKDLYQSNNFTTDYLNCNNEFITWSEIKPHHRYELLNYSIVKLYNIKTKKIKTINKKTKYIFPSLSNSSPYLVMIEIDNHLNKYLVIYNIENNKIIYKINSINNSELQFPRFDEKNEKIYVITNSDSGKSIYKYDLKKHEWFKIFGPILYDISNLYVYKNYILFNSNFREHENIFLYDQIKNCIFQITNFKYSATNPIIFKDTLYFTYLTSKGWKIGKKYLDTNTFINKIPISIFNSKQNYINLDNEIYNYNYSYNPKSYNKILNTLKIHSWLPFYIDAFDYENLNVKPGISIFSQDLLNTTLLQFSYYNENKTNYFYSKINYSGLPIIIDLDYKYGGYQKRLFDNEINNNLKDQIFSVAFSYPINISTGKYNRYIIPSFHLKYRNILFENNSYGVWFKRYNLYISNFKPLAYKNLYPKFGFSLYEIFINSINRNKYYNYLNAFSINFYLPGLFNNHGFKINFSHQINIPNTFIYNNKKFSIFIPFSIIQYQDGYLNYISEIKSHESIKNSIEYYMPLCYPDYSIPNILFLKRIKTKISFDYFLAKNAYVYYNDYSIKYYDKIELKSSSLQFYFDVHLFRLFLPFEIQYKIHYLFNYNTIKTNFGILLNFNF